MAKEGELKFREDTIEKVNALAVQYQARIH